MQRESDVQIKGSYSNVILRCNNRHAVERSSGGQSPMVKGGGREAKEKSNNSKIKEARQKYMESKCICPYTAKMSNKTYGHKQGLVCEVSSLMCMTCS